MCHINVTHMRTTTIRELKHDTTTVLGWVADGETVEVRRRNLPVALLSPPRSTTARRPDFRARLKAIYGTKISRTTGTALVADARGDT
jgi:antitoxin (DNA-binding transcriptional repressor) of toxin-antitoxin stability system